MSNFRIIVGDKYYMGETGEISDKFHDPWSTNSFHTSRVQRSILGFSDDPLDAKFIQDRTTLIGEARRIIEYLLYTDIGWRDIKIEGEPFAIPLKLNIDYFLDLESDASKMKAINTEMKKQLDISTDLGQKRFEENVALLARAEKAEAKVKELDAMISRESFDRFLVEQLKDPEIARAYAKAIIDENILFEVIKTKSERITELESSLAALKEATRWRKYPEEKPSDNQWVWFLDHFGFIHKYNYHHDIAVDSTYVFWRPVEIPDLRPIDLSEIDKEAAK